MEDAFGPVPKGVFRIWPVKGGRRRLAPRVRPEKARLVPWRL